MDLPVSSNGMNVTAIPPPPSFNINPFQPMFSQPPPPPLVSFGFHQKLIQMPEFPNFQPPNSQFMTPPPRPPPAPFSIPPPSVDIHFAATASFSLSSIPPPPPQTDGGASSSKRQDPLPMPPDSKRIATRPV